MKLYIWIPIVILASVFIAVGILSFKNLKNKYYRSIELEQNIIKLQEKENRIKNIEKTLMIHYRLCWYEAHYYAIIMDDFSQRDSIPWQIYAAMVRVESNYDPTVVSSKGAKGMTQILESTAKGVAEELGIPYVDKRTLWNDVLNMVLGFHYLSTSIKSKGFEDGIRCYIGGPGFDKGRKDVNDYRTTIRWEFERLQYIHAGIMNKSYEFYVSDTLNGNN